MKNKLAKPQAEPSAETLFRYQLVSQVLSCELRGEKRADAVRAVAARTHLTIQGSSRYVCVRTLYRWLAVFEMDGFPALEPQSRQHIDSSTVLPEKLLSFFKEQKQLDPKTSIPELIQRASLLHLIDLPQQVDRTTIWRSLKRMGVDTTRGITPEKDRDCRRFAYPHRMDMVLCDGKHFRAGAKRLRRVALFFLDDATRKNLGLVVGTAESSELFLRGLYKIVLKYGKMKAAYVDHGPGFIANDTLCVMRQLNVPCIHGSVRYPEGHGKIEKFNQTVQARVLRTLDKNPEVDPSCEALELRLHHYLFKQYNHTAHEGIDNQTPWNRFHNDASPLRFEENQELLRKAFVVRLSRRVSKDNIVSVDSTAYEVPRGYTLKKIILYRQLLDQTISMIHECRHVRLHPVDLHANARDRRGKTKEKTDTCTPLPKTSAQIDFENTMRPIVDASGGFSNPIKEKTNE